MPINISPDDSSVLDQWQSPEPSSPSSAPSPTNLHFAPSYRSHPGYSGPFQPTWAERQWNGLTSGVADIFAPHQAPELSFQSQRPRQESSGPFLAPRPTSGNNYLLGQEDTPDTDTMYSGLAIRTSDNIGTVPKGLGPSLRQVGELAPRPQSPLTVAASTPGGGDTNASPGAATTASTSSTSPYHFGGVGGLETAANDPRISALLDFAKNPDPSGKGALLAAQRDAAFKDKSNAIQNAINVLQGTKQGQNVNVPLLRAAAALGMPTRSGSWGETMANAMNAGAEGLEKQRPHEMEYAKNLGTLGIGAGSVGVEDMESAQKEYLAQLGVTERALNAAALTGQRETTANTRATQQADSVQAKIDAATANLQTRLKGNFDIATLKSQSQHLTPFANTVEWLMKPGPNGEPPRAKSYEEAYEFADAQRSQQKILAEAPKYALILRGQNPQWTQEQAMAEAVQQLNRARAAMTPGYAAAREKLFTPQYSADMAVKTYAQRPTPETLQLILAESTKLGPSHLTAVTNALKAKGVGVPTSSPTQTPAPAQPAPAQPAPAPEWAPASSDEAP